MIKKIKSKTDIFKISEKEDWDAMCRVCDALGVKDA